MMNGYNLRVKMWKGEQAGDMFKFLSKTEKTDVTEFFAQNLGRMGSFTGDFDSMLAKAQDNIIYNFGGRVGTFVEDGAKLSMYMSKKAEGYKSFEAAQEVRKYLFDYQDLTNREREMFKRVFPFYTWTRKNIPLQAAMLIQDPAKFTKIDKFKNAVEDWSNGKQLPDEYMPGWLKEAFPIYFGQTADGLSRYIKMEGFLPAVDLNMLSRAHEVPIEMLSPLIKTPFELLTNYSTFYKQPIQDYKGERERFLGMYMNPKVAYAARNFRPLSEINKALGLGNEKEIPELKTRLMNLLIGKSYNFSLKTQRDIFDWVQQSQETELNKAIKEARSKGATREVQRLRDELKKVQRGEGITL